VLLLLLVCSESLDCLPWSSVVITVAHTFVLHRASLYSFLLFFRVQFQSPSACR